MTYKDLALLMRANQCVDWLLLQSLGFKNSAAVTCGQMSSGQEKTLTAKGNWLLLHFHTAMANEAGRSGSNEVDDDLDPNGKVMKKMKGFKVQVTSKSFTPHYHFYDLDEWGERKTVRYSYRLNVYM